MKKSMFFLLVLLFSNSVWASSVTFEWDHEDGVAGYRFYQSDVSGSYSDNPIETIPAGTKTVTIEVAEGRWYWVVTAYDSEGESGHSNEVTAQIGPEVPDTTPPDAPFDLAVTIVGEIPSEPAWAGSDAVPADRDGATVANYTYIFNEAATVSGYVTEIQIYLADASGGVLDFAVFRNVSGNSYSDDHVVLGLNIVNGLNVFTFDDELPIEIGEYVGFYVTSDGLIDRWQSSGPGPGYMYDSGDQIGGSPNDTSFTASPNVGYELQVRVKIEE